MVGDRQECFEPEDLSLLATLFDETWAAIGASFSRERAAAERMKLASILFQLSALKQLRADQIKQMALRHFSGVSDDHQSPSPL
jgi:hypothetical protein